MRNKHAKLLMSAVLSVALLAGCSQSQNTGSNAAGNNGQTETNDTDKVKIGVLSYLDYTEEEYKQSEQLRFVTASILKEEGYLKDELNDEADPLIKADDIEIKFYDSLDTMTMALDSGEIQYADIFQSVGKYLASRNDSVKAYAQFDVYKERNLFSYLAIPKLSNGFSFMMMEDHEALRDEFNSAIESMGRDQTLRQYIDEYIDAVSEGAEEKKVEIENIEGRETIRVGITGMLPPMDYIAADGTPAGFNTAVLAEIGRRIDKNIELVQIDNVGRAAALASGTVDVVFWTRNNPFILDFFGMTEDEIKKAYEEQIKPYLNEKEYSALENLEEILPTERVYTMDRPMGTLITHPYYTDIIVPITSKANFDAVKAGK